MDHTPTQQIQQLLAEILEPGQHLLQCQVSPANSTTVVHVVVDSEDGINIDQVGEISGKLGEKIEEQSIFTHAYNLEVSSPGLDWPLQYPWQYKKNIGRLLRITPTEGSDMLARLDDITETELILQQQKQVGKKKGQVKWEPLTLALANIKKAVAEPSFK